MIRVLLVCTGNMCRSPLAEALLRAEFERRGEDETEVTSAGTGAWDGSAASEGAYLVGLENDLDLSSHRARLLSRELVGQSDLILTMARHHRGRVEELGGRGRVHLLGEYAGFQGSEAEVADPFGADLDVYRRTFNQLSEFVAAVAGRIVEERDAQDRGD